MLNCFSSLVCILTKIGMNDFHLCVLWFCGCLLLADEYSLNLNRRKYNRINFFMIISFSELWGLNYALRDGENQNLMCRVGVKIEKLHSNLNLNLLGGCWEWEVTHLNLLSFNGWTTLCLTKTQDWNYKDASMRDQLVVLVESVEHLGGVLLVPRFVETGRWNRSRRVVTRNTHHTRKEAGRGINSFIDSTIGIILTPSDQTLFHFT